MKKRASSIDVAKLAGVSQSAVSRAFSPGASISKSTAKKVHKAASELGYKPNALARSLITSRTNMIALVAGDLQHPFYAKIVNECSLRFQAAGFHVLLFSVTNEDSVDAAVNEVLKYRVDGVLLTSAEVSTGVAEACQQVGTPVVLYNRHANVAGVSSVLVENAGSCAAVADYLVDLGCRRIGYIAGTDIDGINADRERGFISRLEERGLTLFCRDQGDYNFDSGRAAFKRLWSKPERPDALFCASDRMAFGAMDAARFDLGLSVPGDISIVGFDDLQPAAYPSYALTTVHQPVEAMAHAAVDLMISKIVEPKTSPRTILIPGQLVIRSSTAARQPTR